MRGNANNHGGALVIAGEVMGNVNAHSGVTRIAPGAVIHGIVSGAVELVDALGRGA